MQYLLLEIPSLTVPKFHKNFNVIHILNQLMFCYTWWNSSGSLLRAVTTTTTSSSSSATADPYVPMKLTSHLHLVPRSRIVELYLHSLHISS
jgi:hypothetical protein